MVSRKLFQFSLAPEAAEAPLAEPPVLEDEPAELSHAHRSGRPSLGSLLVGAGHVTEEQIKDALAEGIRTGERLGEVLVRRRVVTDEVIAELLASQWQVPFVKTAALSVDPTAIRQFPHRVARELDAVPIGFERDGVVLVAIAEPSEDTFRRLSERLPDSSCVVIARSALDSLLESRLYAAAPDEPEYSFVPEPEPEPEPGPAAVEPSPPEQFVWDSLTVVEPEVPLLDSFDEREDPEAPSLYDEAEPEPELQPEPEPESEPEPQLESEPEFEFEFEPEPAPAAELDSAPAPVDYGWESSSPVAEEPDPVPVFAPAPDRIETAAEPLPDVRADEELPTDIDAAMGSIRAASTELETVRSEVAGLGRALERVRMQLAERDAQLAESEAQREAAERIIEEERETARQLRAELESNSTVIAGIRLQVAGLCERLDTIAFPGADSAEH